MSRKILVLAAVLTLAFGGWTATLAFQEGGCGGGECVDCHSLSKEEAAQLLGGAVEKVLAVEMSEVRGLWVVDVEKGGNKWPVYVDFSKGYLINGQIFKLATKENVTANRYVKLNPVDVSSIPLDTAIVVGSPKARKKVIVFSDPDCSFCRKLHEESKKAVKKDPDVAFYVKLYSRNNNPVTAEKALSATCAKSEKLLDDAYAGKELPPPLCNPKVVQETAALAQRLGIRGTPAMILPDGRLVNGYKEADAILKLLAETGESTAEAEKGKK